MRDKGEYLFTSESVSEGHPDKVADRISDTVLDAFLAADPYARVACETLVTTNRIVLAGEMRGPDGASAWRRRSRAAVKDIGYDQEGFSWRHADVENHLHAQSADIAQGVEAAGNKDEGAGDQGIMFGYATTETPALMPAPLHYAHLILRVIARTAACGRPRVRGPAARREEPGHPALRRWQAGRRHLRRDLDPARRGHGAGGDQGAAAAADRGGAAGRLDVRRRTSSTSTRPAISSSAARTAIAA